MIFIFVENSIKIKQNFKEKGVSRPARPIPKFALAWSPIISIHRELTETGLHKKQLDGLQLITGDVPGKFLLKLQLTNFIYKHLPYY